MKNLAKNPTRDRKCSLVPDETIPARVPTGRKEKAVSVPGGIEIFLIISIEAIFAGIWHKFFKCVTTQLLLRGILGAFKGNSVSHEKSLPRATVSNANI